MNDVADPPLKARLVWISMCLRNLPDLYTLSLPPPVKIRSCAYSKYSLVFVVNPPPVKIRGLDNVLLSALVFVHAGRTLPPVTATPSSTRRQLRGGVALFSLSASERCTAAFDAE
jgi:hypothetical protein